MIYVKVYTGINWPESTWKNFMSAMKVTIGKVVGYDQEVYVFFPKLEQLEQVGDDRFMLIEISTEEGYDKRLALKQKVEALARNFGVEDPLQVVVQECLRA